MPKDKEVEKCKCLSEVNEKLREGYDDEKAEIVTILCLSGNHLDAYPGLTAKYRPKKKDGTFGKEKTVSIRPSFCPFCGKNYEE